ncbi:hypothetical protein DVR12_21295 [Chitinophaga silvatica]|uniref:Leucine carboxyl methyltransferase n=1 Tax=Chitinophaga silvatica TaxID=2282649 RepID=A0A3E1Y4U0_9BACT|nr:class I SAM-dependent methyltransferase [Chitinophaga silvatica]RFS19642.1 hypothetical protein DVR12_21295 [Chitinophaga silvatica]
MIPKLKVRATSRLVLEAALPLYNTALQQQYIDAIDFSETSRLLYELKLHYPPFIEIIKLRKLGIRHLLNEALSLHPIQQIVILGSGLDPLSLYLLENYPQLRNIIEVDNGYIAEKRAIYDTILPEQNLIHFAPCDITDTSLLWSSLINNGYDPTSPVIIVFEGIIHYISSEAFSKVMQLFQSPRHMNLVMLDYTLSVEEVPKAQQAIHEGVLNMLASNLPEPLKVFSRHQMNAILKSLHATSINRASIHLLEKLYSQSTHFPVDGEGGLELISFYL